MSSGVLLQQRSGVPRASAAGKRLSCISCRERKIKCDRAYPCSQCLASDIQCVFPNRRARVSRSSKNLSISRDEELLRRINHLEQMLAEKANPGQVGVDDGEFVVTPNSTVLLPLLGGGTRVKDDSTGVTIDNQYAAFVQQQASSSRQLNTEFWSSFSNEFDMLRQLVEENTDDQDEDEDHDHEIDIDDSRSFSTESMNSSLNFILQHPNSRARASIEYPSESHSAFLFKIYFANVDPVCKILHRPTAMAYFSNIQALLDPLTRRFKFRSFEAITFATYFAAVNSMSPQECLLNLSEEKDVLLARYRHATELVLAQADFLNSPEIVTLQALIIYIVTTRCLDRARSTWTLIGLAVRIAHGCGLHRDGDGRAFSAFEAEMRRRLWWQIVALDMRGSEDRGSESVLAINSFNTKIPCNINDNDLKHDSQHPVQSRVGSTEMSLCLLSIDALNTARKINFKYPGTEPTDLEALERKNLVQEYEKRIQSTHLANCDFSDPRTRLLSKMGKYWTSRLWLIFYYPVYHRMSSQQLRSRTEGLQAAVEFLNITEELEQHSSSVCFRWLFKSYAPWHAVAVVLAELCQQPLEPLANRAWTIIDRRFIDWSGRVADAKEKMLWNSINKLLKQARSARQYSQELVIAEQASNRSESVPDSQDFTGNSNSTYSQLYVNFGLVNEATDQPLDLQKYPSTSTMPADIESSATSSDLINWNDFIFDLNTLDGDFFVEPYEMRSMQI